MAERQAQASPAKQGYICAEGHKLDGTWHHNKLFIVVSIDVNATNFTYMFAYANRDGRWEM